METATRPKELQVLERLLQTRLHSALSAKIPVQIRCAMGSDALLVLTQHPAEAIPDPQQTFKTLEQTLKVLQPEFGREVQLYLRVAGQKQPYAFHAFTVEPVAAFGRKTTPGAETADVEETISRPEAVVVPPGEARTPQKRIWNGESSSFDNSSQTAETGSSLAAFTVDGEEGEDPLPETTADVEVLSDETPSAENSHRKLPPLRVLLTGAGIGLACFLGTFYFLTRPCVVGSCREIPAARTLSQQALRTLQRPVSGSEILAVQQQLAQATEILKSIPPWSVHHREAQNQLKAYFQEAQMLNQLVEGLQRGATAAERSLNPPHSPSEWREIQQLWREAISLLEAVPPNRNLNQLRQQKLKDYRLNLAAANWRLTAEKKATENLEAAKEGVRVAEARQGVAQSLESWQLVHISWLTAVNRLKEIPQGTTAYAESQQMLRAYEPKLAAAYDRKVQEQIAANTYRQAIKQAKLAESFQGQEQWSLAVMNWRNAVASARKVPEGTFFYRNAQPLIGSYTEALKQAEVKLRLVTALQQTQNDLQQTCSGTPKLCDYTVTSTVIKVQMTPAYMQMLDQTAIAAQESGDPRTQDALLNHVQALAEALKAISNNAGIPLELYAPDGYLMRVHQPS